MALLACIPRSFRSGSAKHQHHPRHLGHVPEDMDEDAAEKVAAVAWDES